MIQICIMSGHSGQMRPEKRIYFTLMGGCELERPTLARQIVAQRRHREKGRTEPLHQLFITILGATEITVPTLATEFIDLREMVNNGMMSIGDWDDAVAELSQDSYTVASLTLMGGFSDGAIPEENAEIDSLALQRHLGNISESAGQVLQLGIGQRDSERRETIRRAMMVEGASA